jgi:hypothetical protein
MTVNDYNRRGIRALELAQKACGIRSAEAFAKLLAERTGGSSPDGSTYRRWLRGDGVIPAWAIIAAAEEAHESFDSLLGADNLPSSSVQELEHVKTLLGVLQAQMIEVREQLHLPWRTTDEKAEDGQNATG